MFGWRRRSEGFEWQEYVRTTVLVRRADRQRKIDDVRVAAINKVKDTADRGVAVGRAGVETVTQTTSQMIRAAARGLWQAIAAASKSAWLMISAVSATLWQTARSATTAFTNWVAALPWPTIDWQKVPRPSFPRTLLGRVTAARSHSTASDGSSINPDVGFRLPFSANMIGGAALVIGLIFLIGPMLNSESALTPAKFEPSVTTASVNSEAQRRERSTTRAANATGSITGRATVVSGDMLRINGTQIKLAGIEAPIANQRCGMSDGRTWNCGSSARSALDRIVRRRSVTCTQLEATGSQGTTVANCTANEADIAEALVRNGHVFAASGFFSTYGSTEADARAAKVGLWQGDAKHPDDWRKEIWEDAKRAAPDGCPIKGRVRASSRVYTMPWSDGYDGNRVRTERGDRWFCSEEEAQAAGFTPAQRS